MLLEFNSVSSEINVNNDLNNNGGHTTLCIDKHQTRPILLGYFETEP